ncbi:MAG: ABC transporter ATP-binding protein, partial [Candidatus Aminicenantes bacterium]|nr:ABC transporter ATP-binding protein [Candidatus Aminicenantes bacterium]
MMVIHNFTYMKIPIYFKEILDEIMGNNRMGVIRANILPVVFYTLITVLAMVYMRKLIIGVSRKIEYRFRVRLYEKLLSLNYSFYIQNETGDIVSRCTNDLNDVRTLLGPGIMYVPNALSRLLIFFPVLFKLNFQMLIIISLMQGGLVVLIILILPRIRPLYQKIQEFIGSINNRVWQVVSGITTIKLYTLEKTEVGRFEQLNQQYISQQMSLVKRIGFLWPFFLFVISLTELVILLMGGREVIAGRMTLGELLQFTIMVSYLTFPVLSMGWIMSLLQQGISAMKRINHILLQPDKKEPGQDSLKESLLDIRINRLTFRYPGNNQEVLKNISLEIRPGQIIGIAGPVGSGKSTLLQLISGIFRSDPDMIYINGRDIISLDPDGLMQNISMVPQYTFLFSKSIRQNILMSARSDEQKLDSVVKTAGLFDELGTFPEGIDQVVGERGITLSGGQKQRIAIARA